MACWMIPRCLLGPTDAVDYETVTAPLWALLDEITPNLWRSGPCLSGKRTPHLDSFWPMARLI